jgi:hypothetical protein
LAFPNELLSLLLPLFVFPKSLLFTEGFIGFDGLVGEELVLEEIDRAERILNILRSQILIAVLLTVFD